MEKLTSCSETTNTVNDTLSDQLKQVEEVTNNSINLQSKSKELNEIIHQFKLK